MKEIQIGIALSRNSEKYLEFLLWTISKTASHPENLKFFLGVNHGASGDAIQRIVSNAGVNADIFSANPGNDYGSANHGLALDIIFERMQSGIGMFVDCDIAFLEHGWDEKLLSKYFSDDDMHTIVGTEYDGPKYLNFPNVIFCMFNVDHLREAGIKFKPEGGWHTVTEETAKFYCRKLGERILLDTGSELPRKLSSSCRTQCLYLHRADSPFSEFMIEGLRGEEYRLGSVTFCTHLGRSYTREFGVDRDAIAWEKRVREWLK